MPRKEPIYNVRIIDMSEEEKKVFEEKVTLEVAKFLMQVLPIEIIEKLLEEV